MNKFKKEERQIWRSSFIGEIVLFSEGLPDYREIDLVINTRRY